MSRTDLEDFERARLEADCRYNDALTALDRAVVELRSHPALTSDDLRHLGSLLLVFLQQLTAFVDTRDRVTSETILTEVKATRRGMDSITEMRQQLALLQRAVQALQREPQAAPARVPAAAFPPGFDARGTPHAHLEIGDLRYVGFEDRFRGADADVGARMSPYVPFFERASEVLDIGCGRGEFLALLRDKGIAARGVDVNQEMVAVTRERGLEAAVADGLSYLRLLPDQSLGGLMAAQVVEHLEPAYLVALLDAAFDKLRPGSPLVIETINPACWLAFFSSYLRDLTHVRAIHPETLQYLLQASGFSDVSVRYSAPVPEHVKMQPITLDARVIGSTDPVARALHDASHVVNANAAILNNLLFTHLDYAAVGYRS